MREIQFRAKRKDNGEWVAGSLVSTALGDSTQPYMFWIVLRDASYEVIPETVGQFTGLKDKEEVMIFEGDIIHSLDSTGGNVLHVIVFEDAGFRLKSPKVNPAFSDCGRLKQIWIDEFEKEIIGNIHDNPELLK